MCYSFWCGAASRVSIDCDLCGGIRAKEQVYPQVLSSQAMFDVSSNSQALLGAQSPIGGFGKASGEFPGK